MAAAAPRLPAPPNFLNLSRCVAGPALSDRSCPERTDTDRRSSKSSALRLVLEASPRGVKVPGGFEMSGMRPCACEPNTGIALLLWRRGTAPNRDSPETNRRSLWTHRGSPHLLGNFGMADPASRFGGGRKVVGRREAYRRSACRPRRPVCALERLCGSHSAIHQHAGGLPHAQHAVQHGYGPSAQHRRHPGGKVIEQQFTATSDACHGCLEVKTDTFTEPATPGPAAAFTCLRRLRMFTLFCAEATPPRPAACTWSPATMIRRRTDVMDSHGIAPGANDDASGTAVSMEMCAEF